MNPTTEAFVGTGHDQQSLLAVQGFGLRLLEDGVRGLSVDAGVRHSLLGAGQAGRSDDLHSVGDLFDVLYGFQTAFDFAEGCKIGDARGRSPAIISH